MARGDFASQPQQIGFLRRLVTAYRGVHTVWALARDIVFRQMQCQPKAKAQHALAIARWVQQNITYANEGDEQFQTPLATLRFKYGDCDDFTSLTAALVESLAIPCQLVAVAWADKLTLPFGQRSKGPWATVFGPETFRHIFPTALIPAGGRFVPMPLDSTLDQSVETLTNPVQLAIARGVMPRILVL